MPEPEVKREQPHLEVTTVLQIARQRLALEFSLHEPWSTLFGVSGVGKTTLLRAIAGLSSPCAGWIRVFGRQVLHVSQGIDVPIAERPVRMAAQQPWLFPTLTVRGNLLFGSSGASEQDLPELAALLEISDLLDRRPRELSGGEQQRVNLGRATLAAAAHQCLLLLDEPFTGLDAGLRDRIAPALRQWLGKRRVKVLSVTHDVAELFLLRPEILRIADGRIREQGPAHVVLRAERERLLALLAGEECQVRRGPTNRGSSD